MAGILLEQERFELERQERISKLKESERESQRRDAEQKTLQDMLAQDAALLDQVTISDEAMQ